MTDAELLGECRNARRMYHRAASATPPDWETRRRCFKRYTEALYALSPEQQELERRGGLLEPDDEVIPEPDSGEAAVAGHPG